MRHTAKMNLYRTKPNERRLFAGRLAWGRSATLACLAASAFACMQDASTIPSIDNTVPSDGNQTMIGPEVTPTPTHTPTPTASVTNSPTDFNTAFSAGLAVRVYLRGSDMSFASPPSPSDIAAQMAWAQNRAPDYAFVDTAVDARAGLALSGRDVTPLSTFFGADATGPLTAVMPDLNTTVANWSGYVRVSVAGDYNVVFDADDGGSVYYNGNGIWGSGTLVAQANWQARLAAPGQDVMHIAQAGDYPIQVFWYNQTQNGGGNADIFLSFSGPGPLTFVH